MKKNLRQPDSPSAESLAYTAPESIILCDLCLAPDSTRTCDNCGQRYCENCGSEEDDTCEDCWDE